jgi:hypothetical protein
MDFAVFGSGAPVGFRRTLTFADFSGIATANQTVINGNDSKIGELTVLAGQAIAIGQDVPLGGSGNQVHGAPIYFRVDNESGVQIHGNLKIAYVDPQYQKIVPIYEESSYRLDDGSDGDITKSPVVALTKRRNAKGNLAPFVVPRDGKIVLYFNPSGVAGTSQTVDYNGTNTRSSIPATYYQ